MKTSEIYQNRKNFFLRRVRWKTFFRKYMLSYSLILMFLVFSNCSKKRNDGGASGNNPTPAVNAEVTVMTNDTNQIVEGFGCATVFVPATPLSSDDLDNLFGSGPGQVGLNILRIRVTSDAGWRAVELANAKGAIQRGTKVLATPWSPPANMKTNKNLIGGSLIADSSAAYAKYLNDFADYMSANGAPLYAISVQNEPDISVNYESCGWTAEQMRDFLKNYGQLVTKTKLMAPESFNNNQDYVNTILNDNAAAANVDIIGGHIYGAGITENPTAENEGKEVWMTEHLDTNVTYTADLNTAVEIHNCLTLANFSAYIWWYGKRFYGMIGEDGAVTKRGYIMSQFARFIKPGSVRLGTSPNTQADVLVSAYGDGNGKKTIVIINTGNDIVQQKINISNANAGDFIPYTTTADSNVVAAAKISSSNSSFTCTLSPNSLTTLVEQ
jgi:glucuronoarabinoxylan endo-1,4-beta-xylanase